MFNDLEKLDLEISSERPIQRKRNAIRPDISLWRSNELLAIIECKTQLGWHRENWRSHFEEREESYEKARRQAAKQTGLIISTFPQECLSALELILDENWLPQ